MATIITKPTIKKNSGVKDDSRTRCRNFTVNEKISEPSAVASYPWSKIAGNFSGKKQRGKIRRPMKKMKKEVALSSS